MQCVNKLMNMSLATISDLVSSRLHGAFFFPLMGVPLVRRNVTVSVSPFAVIVLVWTRVVVSATLCGVSVRVLLL